ncbi:hypothetical protein RB200_00425 [Streptomyces sp. PmtG]
MDLTPYVDDFRHELAVAADAGGDEARALARRLTAPLESAARLTLLNALSEAMGEVTRELAPGSVVVVQLRGREPEFVVTPAPPPIAAKAPPPTGRTSLADLSDTLSGGYIRLRFATAGGLDAATALFHHATPDHETLALCLPTDGSVPTLRAVLDALDEAGVETTGLTVHAPTLDDVFSSLTGALEPEDDAV